MASIDPASESRVRIARQTIGSLPTYGLRHQIEGDANGWYIWYGDWSDDSDFFQSLCVEHLSEHLPEILRYLSLPPGFRFLIDNEGYEDVWFDESLLTK